MLIGFRAPGRALGERTLEQRDPEPDRIPGTDDDADSHFGALALASIAGAGGAAETRVTIQTENGDFFGKVRSPRLHKCADNRTVKLYKQRGPNQNPSREEVVASDTSELQGDYGVWSTGNTGLTGKFYARAGKKPGCKADASRTVHT